MTQSLKTLHHKRCVCQICTCTKHSCPVPDFNHVFEPVTTYTNDFHKHPIHVWVKPPPKGAPELRPYDYINSAYREHYPGHPAQPLQKIKPRVKQQDMKLPWKGNSEYKTNYGPKSVRKQPLKNKNIYIPTNQPFQPGTTYKSDYNKKKLPSKKPKEQQIIDFPPGYKFNAQTTYGTSFSEKPLQKLTNYKPKEQIAPKGPHDLNTIYRQDYIQKPLEEPCPIYSLPKYEKKIKIPYSHFEYDGFNNKWTKK